MTRLAEILDTLWGTRIEQLSIDMERKSIKIVVGVKEGAVVRRHEVILEDVVAFCWISNKGEERLQPVQWPYDELTSAGMSENTEIQIRGNEWESAFHARPNIVLEIWNSILLVEAKRVRADNQTHVLIED